MSRLKYETFKRNKLNNRETSDLKADGQIIPKKKVEHQKLNKSKPDPRHYDLTTQHRHERNKHSTAKQKKIDGKRRQRAMM